MSLLEVARPVPGTTVAPVKKLTLREVRAELDKIQMSIAHDADTGEYRVNHKGFRNHDGAHRTNDLADALATGKDMYDRLWRQIKAESAD